MSNQRRDMHNWRVNRDGSMAGPAEGPERTKYGVIDKNGDVYSDGKKIGFVDYDGSVYDQVQNRVGWVDSDGLIYNAGNIPIGEVTNQGEVHNIIGAIRGWVDLKIHSENYPSSARPMFMRAAAAAFILIFQN